MFFVVAAAPAAAADWLRFGVDPARSGEFRGKTGIGRGNVGGLVAQRVALPGTVDSSPLYLSNVSVAGARRDVFVVTTTYGRTLAVDAGSGAVLWHFVPRGIARWEGSNQYTTASPVADARRRYVYAVAPGGFVHKLSVTSGREVRAGRWPVRVTHMPKTEKLSSALNITGRRVLVTTASFQDRFPYQGHVVSIDRVSGRVRGVFNALCANRKRLLRPGDCKNNTAGIWGRGGAVVEPGSGRLLVTTGNAPLNHRNAFGDSLIELSPDARKITKVWNPRDYRRRQIEDVDLGSGSPALLRHRGRTIVFQADKDSTARILDLRRMRRRGKPGRMPGHLHTVRVGRGAPFVAAPTVWRKRRTVFLANAATVVALRVTGRKPRLRRVWQRKIPGTSPVLAGGLLYVYDHLNGKLRVLEPATGRTVASLALEPGHWNSPVVADGRIALGTGDGRDHELTGALYIWRKP